MIYLIFFLLSLFFTYVIRKIAIKKSIIDIPNDRSSHIVPTPHGGGIAIALTWFGSLIYLYLSNQIQSSLFYALLVGIVISLVSFFDDIYELSPKVRLLTQAFVAILGLFAIGGFTSLNLGFFLIENQIITNAFSFLLIIWFINLYNFLDGINGYAGSEAVFLSLAGLLIFGGVHFGILAVCVLGFLFWNYNKAKIFMGDVGSTLLGYNIAIFTLYYSNIESSNFWIWVVLFGVFWFDATLTLIRRKLKREKLTQAHKKHAYQRLNQSGWSHFKVTNFSIAVNIIFFLLIYLISNIFIVFIISIIILSFIMRYIDSKKSFN